MHAISLIKSWLKKKIKRGSFLWISLKCLMAPVNFLSNLRYLKEHYRAQAYPGSFKDNFTQWLYLLLHGKVDLIYKVYFNKAFNFSKIDPRVIEGLRETMPLNDEGCLFEGFHSLRTRTQIIFLASIMRQVNAKRILETGTHIAMFCYIAYLCDRSVNIDTFGDLAASQESVNILNQKFGEYIKFHSGDSRISLKSFSPAYKISFAWIDGGHSFEVCMSDLVNCSRLGIPFIAVDDYKWDKTPDDIKETNEVKKAVDEFVVKHNYSISGISNLVDYRGIVYLTKAPALAR